MKNIQIPKNSNESKFMKSVKYNSVKHKIKSKDDIKLPYDSSQQAFADL